MRILGIDPGLQKLGWGVIETDGNRLHFIASGLVRTTSGLPLYARLSELDQGLASVLRSHEPITAAIEETFMNNNAASALKLGAARGAAIVTVARTGLEVHEYAANLVKKSVVGSGHAAKQQVGMMIRTLLPASGKIGEDEADALAIAICHAHHYQSAKKLSSVVPAKAGTGLPSGSRPDPIPAFAGMTTEGIS
jgi:crossover junction endodeoxyribonuclease RuvC